jgi:hypothetical protein
MSKSRKSRYAKSKVVSFRDRSGETVSLHEPRVAPLVEGTLQLQTGNSDRLDLLAWRFYRDAGKFWRLCDASEELDPFDVIEPGARLTIPPNE